MKSLLTSLNVLTLVITVANCNNVLNTNIISKNKNICHDNIKYIK